MRNVIRYFQIFIGVAAGPGVMFALPYIVHSGKFAEFSGFMATVQFLASLGSVGMEVAAPRDRIRPMMAMKALLCTHFVVFLVALLIFSGRGCLMTFYIVVAVLALNVALVFQNYFLFMGKSLFYAVIGMIRAALVLAACFLALYLHSSLVVAWVVSGVLGALIALLFVGKWCPELNVQGESSVFKVVRQGFSLFVINTAASLPFLVDRLIAKGHLGTEVFARYMVATTWALPMVYIGNTAQQYFIVTRAISGFVSFLKSLRLLMLKCLAFCVVVVLISLVVTPPYFTNGGDFLKIWGVIVAWQAVYCIIAFPLAAVIQGSLSHIALKRLANWTVMLLGVIWLAYYIFIDGLLFNARPWQIAVMSSVGCFAILLPRCYWVIGWLHCQEGA